MPEERGVLSFINTAQAFWGFGAVIVSIFTALVTSATYVKSQFDRINALEIKENAIEKKVNLQEDLLSKLQGSISSVGASLLPPQPVAMSLSSDCGSGSWERIDQASGRFIAAAGKTPDQQVEFQPGFQGNGVTSVKVRPENLPPIQVSIIYDTERAALQNGNYIYMTGLTNNPPNTRGAYQLQIGGTSEPIDTIPPWFGVTVCRHR